MALSSRDNSMQSRVLRLKAHVYTFHHVSYLILESILTLHSVCVCFSHDLMPVENIWGTGLHSLPVLSPLIPLLSSSEDGGGASSTSRPALCFCPQPNLGPHQAKVMGLRSCPSVFLFTTIFFNWHFFCL